MVLYLSLNGTLSDHFCRVSEVSQTLIIEYHKRVALVFLPLVLSPFWACKVGDQLPRAELSAGYATPLWEKNYMQLPQISYHINIIFFSGSALWRLRDWVCLVTEPPP